MGATSGRFVWYDLLTTDLEAAKAFYSDIIGWKMTKWSDGNYEMWTAGTTPVGGLMTLPAEALESGARPYWFSHVTVDDVDGAAKKAQALGGKILRPGTDIPNVGRFAVLTDPQGALFSVFKPKDAGSGPDSRALGHFSWAELNSTDWKSAWKFYSELLGWKKTSSMDMGPQFGEYFMFGTDPKTSMGGMSNAATMMKAPAHWLHYINVKSVDETVQRIPQKGGKVLNGPMDVPGGDRIAQCMDPQGGMFAIFSSGAK